MRSCWQSCPHSEYVKAGLGRSSRVINVVESVVALSVNIARSIFLLGLVIMVGFSGVTPFILLRFFMFGHFYGSFPVTDKM